MIRTLGSKPYGITNQTRTPVFGGVQIVALCYHARNQLTDQPWTDHVDRIV